MRQRAQQGAQRAIRFGETVAAQRHGLVVLVLVNRLGDGARLLDALHQRHGGDAIAANRDHLRLVGGLRGQHGFHGLIAHHRAQVAIEGAGRAAALHVTQHRRAHFLAQFFFEEFLDVRTADRVAVFIARAFGHDDDAVAAAGGAAAL